MGWLIRRWILLLAIAAPLVGGVEAQPDAAVLPLSVPAAQIGSGVCGEARNSDMRRISFNVNADEIGDRAYFLSVMQQIKPRWVLLMSDWGLSLAHDVIAVTEGQTNVVIRFPDNGEAWYWQNDQFIPDAINAWLKLPDPTHPNIFFNVLNEPLMYDQHVAGVTSWLVRFMNEAARYDIKLVVGNFSTGEQSQINAGMYDSLLQTLSMYRGYHYLGVHEYAGPSMPNSIYYPPEWMTETEKVQPDWWPTPGQLLSFQVSQPGQLPPFWLLLRAEWMMIRSRQIGAGELDVVVTEWGWDRLPSLEAEGVYASLEKQYGWPQPYVSMRGLNSLAYVWSAWWPYWSFEQAAFEQLKWADRVYPENYKGMMLFTWSYNEEWNTRNGFNVAPHRALHEMLIQAVHSQDSPPGVTTPVGTPPPATPLWGLPLPTTVPPPAPLPFIESFNSDGGWIASGHWLFDTQTAFNGAGWRVDAAQRDATSTLEYSGALDLRSTDQSALNFWQKGQLASTDSVAVDILPEGGANWIRADSQVGLASDWTLRSVDLTAFAGNVIRLRFVVDTPGTLEDDQTVTGFWLDELAVADAQPESTLFSQVQVVEQRFERGRMFWIAPVKQIWVLAASDGSGTYGLWRVYNDTFADGELESDPSIVAPEGLYQPVRGFGKLWRSTPTLRERLGWARDPEFGHVTCYRYQAGETADAEGQTAPAPGYHIIDSRWGERLLLNETDQTWMVEQQ